MRFEKKKNRLENVNMECVSDSVYLLYTIQFSWFDKEKMRKEEKRQRNLKPHTAQDQAVFQGSIDEFHIVLGGQPMLICFYTLSRVTSNCGTRRHQQLRAHQTS